jgi:hypothetical protein
MIRVRKAAEQGHAKYDWLDTWHTFSFDTYYDPAHMGLTPPGVDCQPWEKRIFCEPTERWAVAGEIMSPLIGVVTPSRPPDHRPLSAEEWQFLRRKTTCQT